MLSTILFLFLTRHYLVALATNIDPETDTDMVHDT